jgi:hypothetical protein
VREARNGGCLSRTTVTMTPPVTTVTIGFLSVILHLFRLNNICDDIEGNHCSVNYDYITKHDIDNYNDSSFINHFHYCIRHGSVVNPRHKPDHHHRKYY